MYIYIHTCIFISLISEEAIIFEIFRLSFPNCLLYILLQQDMYALGTLGMGELYLTEITTFNWTIIDEITEKKNFLALYHVEEKM